MGLDQYGTARKGQPVTDEDGFTCYEDSMELAYWRKHPNLQGWMEDLWIAKGAEGGRDFNCVDLELTLEDLDALEESLDKQALPETEGFFFGADMKYTSSAISRSVFEGLVKDELPGYTVANLRAGYRKDNWSITAFIHNVTDEEYFLYRYDQ